MTDPLILAARLVLYDLQPDGSRVLRRVAASNDAILLYGILHGWFGVAQKPGHPHNAWAPWPTSVEVHVSLTGMDQDAKIVHVATPKGCAKPRPCVDGIDFLAFMGSPDAVFKVRGVRQAPTPRKPCVMLPDVTPAVQTASPVKTRPPLDLLPKNPETRPIRPWPEIRLSKAERRLGRKESRLVPLDERNARGETWPAWVKLAGYDTLLARLDPHAADELFDAWRTGVDPGDYRDLLDKLRAFREDQATGRREKAKAVAPKTPLAVSLAALCRGRGAAGLFTGAAALPETLQDPSAHEVTFLARLRESQAVADALRERRIDDARAARAERAAKRNA